MPGFPVTLGENGQISYSTNGRTSWAATANSFGTYVSSTPPNSLVPINSVRDLDLNLDSAEADVSSRASLWELGAQALLKADTDIEIPWAPTDPAFEALLGAFLTRTSLAMCILDGPFTSHLSQGLWADFAVMSFKRSEPLKKEMLAKVKIKPTASAVSPQWVQIA